MSKKFQMMSIRDCSFEIREGGGGLDSSGLVVCEILWPPLIPVCFFLTPLFTVRKIMAPTEYFPDNLEENVNGKMVLKIRPKICKICLTHFHKFGQASSCNCISCHVRLPMLKKLSRDFLTYTYFLSNFFLSSSNLNKYM